MDVQTLSELRADDIPLTTLPHKDIVATCDATTTPTTASTITITQAQMSPVYREPHADPEDYAAPRGFLVLPTASLNWTEMGSCSVLPHSRWYK